MADEKTIEDTAPEDKLAQKELEKTSSDVVEDLKKNPKTNGKA